MVMSVAPLFWPTLYINQFWQKCCQETQQSIEDSSVSPQSPNYCFCTTLWSRKPKITYIFSRCMVYCQQTHKTHSIYHQVTIAPTSVHKKISSAMKDAYSVCSSPTQIIYQVSRCLSTDATRRAIHRMKWSHSIYGYDTIAILWRDMAQCVKLRATGRFIVLLK